jgi:hypothetical protein
MPHISTQNQPHSLNPWQAALIGALVVVLLWLVLWTSAAARVLPFAIMEPIQAFRPGAGIVGLVTGLLLVGVAGAAVSGLLAVVYNFARRPARRDQTR